MTTAWFDASSFDQHTNGEGHPERPERLQAIREALSDKDVIRVTPPDVDLELLRRVHRPQYIDAVRTACESGGARLDPDTRVVPQSWDAAMQAAGAVQGAVQGVLDGSWRNAFCSVRPPGHHATHSYGMGFCIFDNVAAGAEAALAAGLDRVAILDWDVHHGNGTQDIFWQRADVMFASMHQYPYYPGTGGAAEAGEGPGAGSTVNVPLPKGSGDHDLMRAWQETIRPAFDAFQPQLLLISAGFDADARDPLAGLEVTAAGFERLSADVVRWAEVACGGKVVATLEGGYDLDALAEDVALHVDTLVG